MFAVIALTIPDGVGADRPELRQLAGGADPNLMGAAIPSPPRSECAGAGAQVGRRSGATRRDLQQDDAGIAHPARRLVNASELIDSRRRFIEAVLSSASAGIIGVDASGSVGILNRSRKN